MVWSMTGLLSGCPQINSASGGVEACGIRKFMLVKIPIS